MTRSTYLDQQAEQSTDAALSAALRKRAGRERVAEAVANLERVVEACGLIESAYVSGVETPIYGGFAVRVVLDVAQLHREFPTRREAESYREAASEIIERAT